MAFSGLRMWQVTRPACHFTCPLIYWMSGSSYYRIKSNSSTYSLRSSETWSHYFFISVSGHFPVAALCSEQVSTLFPLQTVPNAASLIQVPSAPPTCLCLPHPSWSNPSPMWSGKSPLEMFFSLILGFSNSGPGVCTQVVYPRSCEVEHGGSLLFIRLPLEQSYLFSVWCTGFCFKKECTFFISTVLKPLGVVSSMALLSIRF